jgi:sugar-specific transcriptional regulator TrmB
VDDTEALTGLGLNQYEATAYLALIRRGSSTAGQVARLGGLPRQRVYDVLASLVDKGLASSQPGPPAKYTAVSPDVCVQRLLAERRQALDALEREARAAAKRLTATYKVGRRHTDPLDYVEVVRDPGLIAQRWNELQHATRKEILVFAKPPYVTPPELNTVGMEVALRRPTRCVYELDVFDNPEVLDGIRRFVAAGEEQRFVAELPLKMAIIDERLVMFAMEDPASGPAALTTLIVEHPALARILKRAFDSIWQEAMTLEQAEAARLRTKAETSAIT